MLITARQTVVVRRVLVTRRAMQILVASLLRLGQLSLLVAHVRADVANALDGLGAA